MAPDEPYSSTSTDGVLVVTFQQSHILDAMGIDRISAGVKELIKNAPETRFLFDLQHVEYLSSTALGMLIGLHRRVVQRRGRLKLAGLQPDVLEVLRLTKLDTVFNIYKDTESAIDAFRKDQ